VSFGLFVGVVAAAAGPEVQFADITRSARVNFKHENSATSTKYLLETMGGGVALLDYDNDGRLDIFFTNGAKIDDPMPDGKLPDKSDPKVLEPPLSSKHPGHIHGCDGKSRPHWDGAELLHGGCSGGRLL